jgi:hypothetical protein
LSDFNKTGIFNLQAHAGVTAAGMTMYGDNEMLQSLMGSNQVERCDIIQGRTALNLGL